MKTKKLLLIAFILFASLVALSFADAPYVATTRWVGAIAELAGAGPVKNFAPDTMVHPPEYELKPEDIALLSKARVVFLAGYETKMVAKINESLKKDGSFTTIQVLTENSLENLKAETEKIAQKLGTLEQCRSNMQALENAFESLRNKLKAANLFGKNAMVHSFQVPLAKSLGFTIVATFGPAPVNSDQIGQASKLKPDIIIDNYHNMVAKPLAEVSKSSKYVSFINFPGLFGTKSIEDVIRYNENQISGAR